VTLAAALHEVRPWTLDVLGRLVACPSATDAGSDLAEVLAPLLEELGLVPERLPCAPEAWRDHPDYSPPEAPPRAPHDGLLARAREEAGPPGLLLFAHTDTEPVHPARAGDPLRLAVVDGRASGLGVADDKAGVVAILAALRALRLAGARPARPPVVLLAPGKQGGALGTLPGVLAAGDVAAAVYCHPAESGHGLAHLKVASRGIARLRVEVPGATPPPLEERTPVSADPRRGRNPLTRAARITSAVAAWDDGEERIWAVLRAEGGGAPFEVPSTFLLEVACWFTAGTPEDVLAAFRDRVAALDAGPWERDHPVRADLVGLRAGPATCAGSAFARRVAGAVAAVAGAPPEPYGWHSASDIRFPLRCLGVPAVGLGPLAGGFYGPGEWVDVASLHATVEVLARLLREAP
jgi:acetylornithine deacetylase